MSFSLWCDFIQRDFLENEFKALIDARLINGATSNPSIFAQSLKTPAYTDSIKALKGKYNKSIYENLAIADIRRAAEILMPIWEQNIANGFVSIEIDPFLCDNAEQSIDEGIRLQQSIAMPNVMIKVPATKVGYEVMSEIMRRGISVNATLVFTPAQAKECAQAMKEGSKTFADSHSIKPQGVISVFVSRFDRAADAMLSENLRAQMGIINAMDCYEIIENSNQSHIRTLFASTGVKGDDLVKSYYIDKLILPHSVNTAPLDAIMAYKTSTDKVQKSLLESSTRARFWQEIARTGIDRAELSQRLLNEGIVAFQKSFEDMLRAF